MSAQPSSRESETRRALVLHGRTMVVDLIGLTLNHGVFQVRAAGDLAAAEAVLAKWRPDIAVVDMDHDDSAALLGRLGAADRPTKWSPPVIGLTRRGDLQAKMRAFDLGAHDILTTPFSPEELLARALALTRRAPGPRGPRMPAIRLGEVEIDILASEVRTRDSVIHLSGIEQSLLYLLASRAGQVVTRDEILDAVWGTDLVDDNDIVDRHVRGLRVQLQGDHRHPRFIATVPGRGYRFTPTSAGAAGDGVPAPPGTRPD